MPTNKSRPLLPIPDVRSAEMVPLSQLHFDINNPRFDPDPKATITDEKAILDKIVEVHGVTDLLSSLAVNGFSTAEPLIGIRTSPTSITVVEGNRRLAASLILAGDSRAANQKKRQQRYQDLRNSYGNNTFSSVPVLIFHKTESKSLLPYLGVRHIVGAEGWSAWSKAAWLARFLKESRGTIDQAMAMIGDDQRQMPRLLASYYFVQQLIEAEKFDPRNSIKKGGGGSQFPFSLIYNGLGYKNIKDWVGFPGDSDPAPNPIPKAKLQAAADFVDFVCGNKSKNVAPVVGDNRDFSELNQVVGNEIALAALRRGEKLDVVARSNLPAHERLVSGLEIIMAQLGELVTLVNKEKLDSDEAGSLLRPAAQVHNLALSLHDSIEEMARPVRLRVRNSPDKPKK